MDKLINGRNWIGFCSSERFISELLIPGTHDTMTADCQQRYYKTQVLSLEKQLSCGVRFLDIRLRKDMFAAHREWKSNITFDLILEKCGDFLQKNSGEFILMRIQNSNEKKDDFSEYGAALLEKIQHHSSLFYSWEKSKLGSEGNPQWPTLKSAKGKIIALECSPINFQFNRLQNRLWAANWHHNPYIVLQDLWDGPSLHKKQEVIQFFIQHSVNIHADKLILNHISATNGDLKYPDVYAEYLNQYTKTCLKKGKEIKGVQIYDFITPGLAQDVFMLNHFDM